MGPWDPNWRPDPTGRRLEAIRVARRGALAAAVIFGTLEVWRRSWRSRPVRDWSRTHAAHRLDARSVQSAGSRPARRRSHLGRARDTPDGGQRRAGDGCRCPGRGGHLGDDRRLRSRRVWAARRPARWMARTSPESCADGCDRGGPDLTAHRDRVRRLGPVRPPTRSAGDDDERGRPRGPRHVVAQARTRTSSPRRMTPGRSTSPHTPNIRSLPSTWPRYSLIARNVS